MPGGAAAPQGGEGGPIPAPALEGGGPRRDGFPPDLRGARRGRPGVARPPCPGRPAAGGLAVLPGRERRHRRGGVGGGGGPPPPGPPGCPPPLPVGGPPPWG